MPPGRVQVRYRVALDSAMQRVIRDAVVETSEAKAHSVHVVLRGLEAGRDYWYQFHFGDESSPVGRTRTTSDSNATATLALASCNHYETGQFAAYADMARAAPDCVVHVGDYIYEGAAGPLGAGRVRQHNGAEITTLWDYRNRYALYKSDPSLQAAHAASPWLVAFDDHEVDNNWAGEVPQDPWAQTPLEFRVRKRAALQAYYEHMPLEQPPSFNGIDAHLQVYGKYRLGPVDLLLTDTRQYRSDQPCGPGFPAEPYCGQLQDPSLTMTGKAQERWLMDGIRRANARYTVIATQTWFAPYRYNAAPESPAVNTDQWTAIRCSDSASLMRWLLHRVRRWCWGVTGTALLRCASTRTRGMSAVRASGTTCVAPRSPPPVRGGSGCLQPAATTRMSIMWTAPTGAIC